MLKFSQYCQRRLDEDLSQQMPGEPSRMPLTMDVEMPLGEFTEDIMALAGAFDNAALKDNDHELKRPEPGKPDPKRVGDEVARLHPSMRKMVKFTGNKLYVVGKVVMDYVDTRLHHPEFNPLNFHPKKIDLATAAIPHVVDMVIKRGVQDRLLPRGVTCTANAKAGNCKVTFPKGHSYVINSFQRGSSDKQQSFATYGSMADDSDRRMSTKDNLYYSITEKKIFDYHGVLGSSMSKAREKTVGLPDKSDKSNKVSQGM